MEAAAMDRLVQKGAFRPEIAQAIGEAMDIAIKAANVVTVPVLDARFAVLEAKLEARFGSIEKSIESTKVWASLLYAGLTIALFSALAVDHHWLANRDDQFAAQLQTRTDSSFAEQQRRSDARFAEQEARSNAEFAQRQARSDARFAEERARSDQRFQQVDAKLDQIRALVLGTPSTRGGLSRPSPTKDPPR